MKRVASKEAVSVWKQRPAMLAAFAYIFLGFGFIIFEETIPLFFASSRGLNFETAQIGIFQSMMGIVLLCTTSVYNFVPDRIGFIRTHRLGLVLLSFVVVLLILEAQK